jgi:hypothetical protein
MHWIICLFVLLLTGCQSSTFLKRWEEPPSLPVMLLWEQYQQCLVATDPDRLLLMVQQLEQVMLPGPKPPVWLQSWGIQVKSQPLRTSVDPQALAAACTIRTAMVMVKQDRLSEARALYQRVVSRYTERERGYYREQAKEALALLQNNEAAVIALRTESASSRSH